jgi:NAD-dependent DNA ligase
VKTLFLDIDGVLNSEAESLGNKDSENVAPSYQEVQRTLQGMKHLRKADIQKRLSELHPAKIQRLNGFIAATGAQVVASTTWRKHHTRVDLQALLAARGFAHSICDYTPDLSKYPYDGTTRGQEIHAWMQANPHVTSIVILDDDDQMEPYRDRLVHVNPFVGLTDRDVEIAIQLIGV